jgi:hypothetical protein
MEHSKDTPDFPEKVAKVYFQSDSDFMLNIAFSV